MPKTTAKSSKPARPRAVVIMGEVEDKESYLPGWNYSYSRAQDRIVRDLEDRGYEVRVYAEPSKKYLRRILKNNSVRAFAVVGHGEFQSKTYSFKLNDKENLSAQDLREWALEDKIKKSRLGKALSASIDANPRALDAMERMASYNFDLSVMHTCHSVRDPAMRTALGGQVKGNPWYSLANLSTWSDTTMHQLRIDPRLFAASPEDAIRSALAREIRSLSSGESAFTTPGYYEACLDALEKVVKIDKKGRNKLQRMLDTLGQRFSTEWDSSLSDAAVSRSEAENSVKLVRERREPQAFPCDVPTKSSKGKLGCRRTVIGGGPCYQHGWVLSPPDD